MSSSRSRFSFGIRKNLDRISSAGLDRLRSNSESSERSNPLRSQSSIHNETTTSKAVRGAVAPSGNIERRPGESLRPHAETAAATDMAAPRFETIPASEREFSAGENAMPALPSHHPTGTPRIENVDAMDFKKFYENFPGELPEQTHEISQTSTRTETSEASSWRSGNTETTQQDSIGPSTSATSRVASNESVDKSWSVEFTQETAESSSGGSSIDSRLSAFYLKKAMELADASHWEEAHVILGKAIQHGYARGSELNSLFKKRQRDEIMNSVMSSVTNKSWGQAQRQLKTLEELGYSQEVSELLVYHRDAEIKSKRQNLSYSLKLDNWENASNILDQMIELGLSSDESHDLRTMVHNAEVQSYKSKFQGTLDRREWDPAEAIINQVDALVHIPNVGAHVLEMRDLLSLGRRAEQRERFDTFLEDGHYEAAETELKRFVGDKTYNSGPPEDIQRAERFYDLMARRHESLRSWEKAADYWNRLRWLLLDQSNERSYGTEPLPDLKEKTRSARFREAKAYLRAKKWDSARGMLNLIDKMQLSQSEKAVLALMSAQRSHWKDLIDLGWTLRPRGAGFEIQLPPEATSRMLFRWKDACLKAVNLLSEIRPEPPELAEAIAMMVQICTMTGETLEKEAYESLLPKDKVMFGSVQISAETSEILRSRKMSFDPITLECIGPPEGVIEAIRLSLLESKYNMDLLDLLLDHSVVKFCNQFKFTQNRMPTYTTLHWTFGQHPPPRGPFKDVPVYAERLLAAACQIGSIEAINRLLDRGLIVIPGSARDAQNYGENLILPAALRSSHLPTIKMVIEAQWHPENDMMLLIKSIDEGSIQSCRAVLDLYGIADINWHVPWKVVAPALSSNGFFGVVFPQRPQKEWPQALEGAAVPRIDTCHLPDTALHYAILRDSIPIVRALLDVGAGMGGRDLSALDWAIYFGKEMIVNELLRRGARITPRGKKLGRSAGRQKLVDSKVVKLIDSKHKRIPEDYPFQETQSGVASSKGR